MTRLADMIDQVIVMEGTRGKLRLAMAVNRGQKTIERYRADECTPSSDLAYKLALACGCSKEIAIQIAKETDRRRAKVSA